MSKLVARFAENVFWVGRYLERAENLARILDINETYARDDPDGPDWKRVLRLYADLKRFESAHGEASAQAVLHYYVIDRDNSSSIVSCIIAARENARSIRHLISTEMWTQINIFRSDIAGLQKKDVTVANLSRVSRDVIAGCQHFEGIAEGTFLRSEPWCFYQLGKYIERADQTTRILDIGYDRLSPADESPVAWVHWNVLLRSVSGYHAYRSRHPGASSPQDIAEFLLYDDEFPRAVGLCLNRITSSLRDLARRHGSDRGARAEFARRQIEAMLEAGPGKSLTSRSLHSYLDRIQSALANMSGEIGKCYFLGR
ncbi:MAG: alpha-E domain-containing protein [Hyphomicrobiaceae bacterium]